MRGFSMPLPMAQLRDARNALHRLAYEILYGIDGFGGALLAHIWQRQHELIFVHYVQITSQFFSDEIGISIVRVEQIDAIFQRIALFSQNRNPFVTLLQQLRVFTPCQQTAGTGDCKDHKEQQRSERHPLGQLLFRQRNLVSLNRHISLESQLIPQGKH